MNPRPLVPDKVTLNYIIYIFYSHLNSILPGKFLLSDPFGLFAIITNIEKQVDFLKERGSMSDTIQKLTLKTVHITNRTLMKKNKI